VDYVVTDERGSVELAAPSLGTPSATRAYDPYGQERAADGAGFATDRGYLGQIEDGATGLSYLNARYYDTGIGMFTAPDPVLDVFNVKSLNPYAYTQGNPIGLTDASGRLSAYTFGVELQNRALRDQNRQLIGHIGQLNGAIGELQDIITTQQNYITQLVAQIEALEAVIRQQQTVINQLQARVAYLTQQVNYWRGRAAYWQGQATYWRGQAQYWRGRAIYWHGVADARALVISALATTVTRQSSTITRLNAQDWFDRRNNAWQSGQIDAQASQIESLSFDLEWARAGRDRLQEEVDDLSEFDWGDWALGMVPGVGEARDIADALGEVHCQIAESWHTRPQAWANC